MLKFIAMAAIAAMSCSQVVSTGGSNIIDGGNNVLLTSTANNILTSAIFYFQSIER